MTDNKVALSHCTEYDTDKLAALLKSQFSSIGVISLSYFLLFILISYGVNKL